MKINTLVQFYSHPDLAPHLAKGEFIVVDEPRAGQVGLRQFHAINMEANGPRIDAFVDDVYATETVTGPVKGAWS